MLSRFYDHLHSSELQFGFKAHRSTAMCTMHVIEEAIAYFVKNGRPVYCCFLVASKAFDKIEYCRLLRMLMKRQLPAVSVELHLRDGRTDRRREYNSRRLSARPFITSRSDVDTAWRRRSVDVVAARVCSSVRPFQTPPKRRTDRRTVCPFARPSVRLLDGVWH